MSGVELALGLIGVADVSIHLCKAIVRFANQYKGLGNKVKDLVGISEKLEKAFDDLRKNLDYIDKSRSNITKLPESDQQSLDEDIGKLRKLFFNGFKKLAVAEYRIQNISKDKNMKFGTRKLAIIVSETLTPITMDFSDLTKDLHLISNSVEILKTRIPVFEIRAEVRAFTTAPAAVLPPQDIFTFAITVPRQKNANITIDFHDDRSNEGRLKRQLLSANTHPCAYAVVGESGVGKSTAFFELPADQDIKRQFPHGFHYIKIGPQATPNDLIYQIVHITQESGGKSTADEMRRTLNLENVVELAADWFNQATILLLLDDISDHTFVSTLYKIISGSRQPSVAVFSSRDQKIAEKIPIAVDVVSFPPKTQEDARKILIEYSKMPETDSNVERHIEYFVKSSSGLPVFLSMSGMAVRGIAAAKPPDRHFEAWADYRRIHENSPNKEKSSQSFEAALKAISNNNASFPGKDKRTITYPDMYQSLCVLRAGEWAPPCMLAILWGLSDESMAGAIASNLSNNNLLIAEKKKVKGTDTSGYVLHSLARDYAIRKEKDATRKHAEKYPDPDARKLAEQEYVQMRHEKLLDAYVAKYRPRNEEQGNCRPWWSPSILNDGYIFANLSWHLYSAGLKKELKELMLSAPWTIRQIQESGFSQFSQDYDILTKWICTEDSADGQSVRRPLKTILDAASLSSIFISTNHDYDVHVIPYPEECSFQIRARLEKEAATCPVINRYVRGIGKRESGVRVVPISDCLTVPGGPLRTMNRCPAYVHSMMMLPDGCTVICACSNGDVFFVNAKNGIKTNCGRYFGESLDSMVLNELGTLMVTSGISGQDGSRIKVWKITPGSDPNLEYWCDTDEKIISMALSRDGRYLIGAKAGGDVDRWDLYSAPNWDRTTKMSPHNNTAINDICFLPENDETKYRVVSGGRDKIVRVWDLKTGALEGKMVGHSDEIKILCASKDGTRIASACKDNDIFLWDVKTFAKVSDTSQSGMLNCLSICKTDEKCTTVIGGSADTSIWICDFYESGRVNCSRLVGHGREIWRIALSSNGNELVSYSEDRKQRSGMICMWDVGIARKTKTDHHSWGVQSLALTPKHDLAISASRDQTLHIWDIETGKKIGKPLIGHTGFVTNAVVTSNGKYIISGSSDETLRVWDLRTQTEIRKLQNVQLERDQNAEDHDSRKNKKYPVRSLAVSDDDEVAVCGSIKGRIHVWDLRPVWDLRTNLQVPCSQLQWDEEYEITFLHLSRCPVTAARWLYVGGKKMVSKWCLDKQQMSATMLDQKENTEAGVVPRRKVLEMFGDQRASAGGHERECIKCEDEKIIWVEGSSEKVLARLESPISQWKITKDRVLCVGTESGLVSFLKICNSTMGEQ